MKIWLFAKSGLNTTEHLSVSKVRLAVDVSNHPERLNWVHGCHIWEYTGKKFREIKWVISSLQPFKWASSNFWILHPIKPVNSFHSRLCKLLYWWHPVTLPHLKKKKKKGPLSTVHKIDKTVITSCLCNVGCIEYRTV